MRRSDEGGIISMWKGEGGCDMVGEKDERDVISTYKDGGKEGSLHYRLKNEQWHRGMTRDGGRGGNGRG